MSNEEQRKEAALALFQDAQDTFNRFADAHDQASELHSANGQEDWAKVHGKFAIAHRSAAQNAERFLALFALILEDE